MKLSPSKKEESDGDKHQNCYHCFLECGNKPKLNGVLLKSGTQFKITQLSWFSLLKQFLSICTTFCLSRTGSEPHQTLMAATHQVSLGGNQRRSAHMLGRWTTDKKESMTVLLGSPSHSCQVLEDQWVSQMFQGYNRDIVIY